MRNLVCAALAALIVAVGCGTSSSSRPAATNPLPCHPRNPPALGECVGQHFGLTKPAPTKTALAPIGRRCEDWSLYQGYAPSTAGLACVILQANHGFGVDPTVYSQASDAHRHGIPCGVYTFLEGNSGGAEARLAVSIYRRAGCTLGVWADAEVGAAYSHACAYTAQAAAEGVLTGLYSAPGLWPGGRCRGYLWPAEWGAGPYAFGGYPFSAIVLWQYCGTCGVDLNRDYGLIALGHPESPGERHARKVHELHAAERTLHGLRGRIGVLRRFQAGFGCVRRRQHHQHLGPRCSRWFAEGNRDHRLGYRLHVLVYQLRKEGIR